MKKWEKNRALYGENNMVRKHNMKFNNPHALILFR